MHRLSTLSNASILFCFIVAGQLVLAAAFASPVTGVSASLQPIYLQLSGSSLLTTAEILAAIIGIVIAVTVFGIQFHGEREGELAFLVPLFGRRMGIMPISAAYLAVITANIVAVLGVGERFEGIASSLGYINCFSIPLLLIAVGWLIFESTSSIGSNLLHKAYLPGLDWCREQVQIGKIRRSRFNTKIATCLNGHRIGSDYRELFVERVGRTFLELEKRLPAAIVDVNMICLASALRDSEKILKAGTFIIGLEAGSNTLKAYVPDGVEGNESGTSDLLSKLGKCVVTGQSPESEYEELLNRLTSHLASNDCAESSRQFVECIGLLRWCIENGKQTDPGGIQFDLHPFISALVYNAWYSADSVRIDALFSLIYEFAGGTHEYFGWLILESIFWRHCSTPDRFPRLEEKLDDMLGFLFSDAKARFHRYESSEPITYDLHRLRMACGIKLAKIALESKRREALANILDRIFCDAQYQMQRQHIRQEFPELDKFANLNAAAAFCLVGWALHLVHIKALEIPDSLRLFEWARSYFRDQIQCMSLWREVSAGPPDADDASTAELGCKDWHPENLRRRTGKIYSNTLAIYWVQRGYLAIGLTLPFSDRDLERLRERKVKPADLAEINLEQTLERIAEHDWFTAEQLGIGESEQDAREHAFLLLWSLSKHNYQLDLLQQLVEAPLDSSAQQEFSENVAQTVLSVLTDLLPSTSANAVKYGLQATTLNFSVNLPRQIFVADQPRIPMLMNGIGVQSRFAVEHWIVKDAFSLCTGAERILLADFVTVAVEWMRSNRESQLAILLSQKAYQALAEFDALHDIVNEYDVSILLAPESADVDGILLDLSRTYATVESPQPARIEIYDLTESEKQSLIDEFQNAPTGTLPRAVDIRVEVCVEFNCPFVRVGTAEPICYGLEFDTDGESYT